MKFDVSFQIQVQRQAAQYSTDVLDALILILKETAHDCNLDYFVEVSSLPHICFVVV